MTDQRANSTDDGPGLPADNAASQASAVAAATSGDDLNARATQAVQELRDPLTRYAAHLLGGDASLGQDVAQDTFEKLLRKPPDGLTDMNDGRLKAWLFTVCRNRALDLRRKDRRMTALPTNSFDQQQETSPGPAESAQSRDTFAALLRRLALLPANQQEVIRLRFHGGMTYPQIAQVTGLTSSNVGYLLHNGLKTLRTQMAEA